MLILIGINEVATIGHDLSSLAYSNSTKQYSNTYNNNNSTLSTIPSMSQSVKIPTVQQPLSTSSNHGIDIDRLAHLVLVDQKLNKTNNNNSSDGVDIIVSTISESILADSYAMKMNDNTNNINKSNTNIDSNNK